MTIDRDQLTDAHKAAAFDWLRYLPERHGEIDVRDRDQADIALRGWHDAEQRAQRAEADRYRLAGWMHAECCAALDRGEDPRTMDIATLIERMGEALATPPPDNEPDNRVMVMDSRGHMWPTHGACLHCGGMGEMHGPGEGGGECPKCNGTGNAPHTPEQAHGDALAALQWLEECAAMQDSHRSGEAAETIRRHLTASGVPYVSNKVRRLPE